MKIRLDEGPFGSYELTPLDKSGKALEKTESILVQQDHDFPGIASVFGWIPCEHCRETDGTVDCAHKKASEMIENATRFLDEHIGERAEDPGYFDCDKIIEKKQDLGFEI